MRQEKVILLSHSGRVIIYNLDGKLENCFRFYHKMSHDTYVLAARTIQENRTDGTFFPVNDYEHEISPESIQYYKSSYLFEPHFTIAGVEEDLVEVLRELTFDDRNKIWSLLNNVITSANYDIPNIEGGKKEEYERILQRYLTNHHPVTF